MLRSVITAWRPRWNSIKRQVTTYTSATSCAGGALTPCQALRSIAAPSPAGIGGPPSAIGLVGDLKESNDESLCHQLRRASVGAIHIPAFELKSGEIACLHMPCPFGSDESVRVVEALLGKLSVPGLRLSARICLASPPMLRPGLLGFFYHPHASTWFRRVTGVRRQPATAAVERVGRLTDDRVTRLRIGRIPWNARVLLGLEAAWASRPDAVLFSTVALDPLGVRMVFDEVGAHLSESAAVYLSYEYSTQGRKGRDHPPGAMCVELQCRSPIRMTASPS